MLRSLLLVVAVATTVSACGSADPGGGSSPQTATDTAVAEALRFTAPLVGGGDFDGSDAAGRPIAFWFWAPT